jgi:hypothetical protein
MQKLKEQVFLYDTQNSDDGNFTKNSHPCSCTEYMFTHETRVIEDRMVRSINETVRNSMFDLNVDAVAYHPKSE